MRRFRRSAQAQRSMAQRQRQRQRKRNERQRTRQKERSIRQAKRKAAQKARQKARTQRVRARQKSRADRVASKAAGGAFVGRQQAIADIGTTAVSEAAKIGGAVATGGLSSIGEGFEGFGGFGGLRDRFQDFGDGSLSGALDTFGDAFGGGGGGAAPAMDSPFIPDFGMEEDEEIIEEEPFYTNPLFLAGSAAALYFLFFRR